MSSDSLIFAPTEFEEIRSRYGLSPITSALSVLGGLSHRLLKLETAHASYALKILSARSVFNSASRDNFERSETVAEMAEQNGIPALVALRGANGAFLQGIGRRWILLYEWREGHVLPPTAVSEAVAAQMGAILGQLHALKIRFKDQDAPKPEAFEAGHWENFAICGRTENANWAGAVTDALPKLIEANERATRSQLALREGWVTGHLDLDQKNVLWHEGQPTILDFESAKPIHPALELVGAALNWAGQSAGDADESIFKAFLRAYRTENEVSNADLQTACDAVLGKWLIWLEFNLRRSSESEIRGTEEERICHDALWHALGVTLKLLEDVPLYQEWCAGAEFSIIRSNSDS